MAAMSSSSSRKSNKNKKSGHGAVQGMSWLFGHRVLLCIQPAVVDINDRIAVIHRGYQQPFGVVCGAGHHHLEPWLVHVHRLQRLRMLGGLFPSAVDDSPYNHRHADGSAEHVKREHVEDQVTGIGTPIADALVPALANVNQLLYMAPSGTNNFLLQAGGGNLNLFDNGVLVAANPLAAKPQQSLYFPSRTCLDSSRDLH